MQIHSVYRVTRRVGDGPAGRTGVLGVLIACLLSSALAAPQTFEFDPEAAFHYQPVPPAQGGQYAGPWAFGEQINFGLPVIPDETWSWQELAHGVALPPPNDGWVMMWCPRGCPGGAEGNPSVANFTPSETFLFSADIPQSVYKVTMPSPLNGIEGSNDPFCGGAALDPLGRLITFGGTDAYASCGEDCPVCTGHDRLWILDDTAIDVRNGIFPAWTESQTGMALPRWYATGIPVVEGRHMVLGHVADPSGLGAEEVMDRGFLNQAGNDVTWDTGPTGQKNRRAEVDAGPTQCDPTDNVFLRDYPRLFQLGNGLIMALIADRGVWNPLGCIIVANTAFLELGVCDPPFPDRWYPGPGYLLGDPTIPAMPHPFSAPAVHLLDDTDPIGPTEVVYTFGGSRCEGPCGGCTGCVDFPDITDKVLRMLDPAPGRTWEDETDDGTGTMVPLLLPYARTESNAVILPDGSVLVVGGYGKDEDDVCRARLVPQRYRPPEIFKTGNWTTFKRMNRQTDPRPYHSWAVLLPDGRVLMGGGHTYEVVPWRIPRGRWRSSARRICSRARGP